MDFSLIMSPIRSFQSMVQCAANTAESIPKEDMLMAFKTSINLLEKVGELMQYSNGIGINNKSNNLIKNGINIYQNSFLNSFNNPNTSVDFCSQSTNFRQNQEAILFSNRMSFSNSDSLSTSCILPITSSPSFAALNCLMKSESNLSNCDPVSSRCDSSILAKSTQNDSHAIRDSDFQFLLTSFLNNNSAAAATITNNSAFPAVASLSDSVMNTEDNSGRNSENPLSNKLAPYLSLGTTTTIADNGYYPASDGSLWNNRCSSPMTSCHTNAVLKDSPSDLSENVQNHKRGGGEPFLNFLSRSRNDQKKNLNSDELNRLLDSCEIRVGGVPGKKNYKCKFCGKMYDIKSSIRYHIRIIHLKMHLKTADMQCKLCGRVFTCATATNKHQLRCLKSSGGQNESRTTADLLHPPSHHIIRTKTVESHQHQAQQRQTIDDCVRSARHHHHHHHLHSNSHYHHNQQPEEREDDDEDGDDIGKSIY